MIVVAIIGILAAIAIPNFIKFQARSKQSEAKTNLKALFQAEKAYFAERDTYSNDMQAIGFIPERGNRYAYRLATTGNLQARNAAALGTQANPTGIAVDRYRLPGATTNPAYSNVNVTLTLDGAASTPTTTPGVRTGSNGSFVGTATGTVDNDVSMDQWLIAGSMSVNVAASNCSDDQDAPSGIPANHFHALPRP